MNGYYLIYWNTCIHIIPDFFCLSNYFASQQRLSRDNCLQYLQQPIKFFVTSNQIVKPTMPIFKIFENSRLLTRSDSCRKHFFLNGPYARWFGNVNNNPTGMKLNQIEFVWHSIRMEYQIFSIKPRCSTSPHFQHFN